METLPDSETTWAREAPHVRKAIAFIRAKKQGVTATELVAWDQAHGRKLFDWNDRTAAVLYREHQARVFLNSFAAIVDKMRVRAFIHVEADDEADIERSAYQRIEAIAVHPGMRRQVIDDLVRRMKTLASELAMWKLSPAEQDEVFAVLRDRINGRRKSAA